MLTPETDLEEHSQIVAGSSAVTDRPAGPQRAVEIYYDGAYAAHQLDVDEAGCDFSKIASLWPATTRRLCVLDIGCGAGTVTAELVRRGHGVVGVDLMGEALARAAERGLETLQLDLNDGALPFDSASFDAVIALDILEHVFTPVALLREFRRLLRPGGFLITLIPNHFDLRQRWRMMCGHGIVHREHLKVYPELSAADYFHIRFFTLNEAAALIAAGGFRPVQTRYTHFRYHPCLRNRIGDWMTQHLPQTFASAVAYHAVPTSAPAQPTARSGADG